MKFQKEIKIGLIITAIIALFIWGLNFLKGRNLFTTQQQYYAVFDNIGGLQQSSSVSINGFKIGQVSEIRFMSSNLNKILVEISIQRQYKIPKNSVIEIVSADLMGTKAVNLVIGNSKFFAEKNDTLLSRAQIDLSTMVSNEILPLKAKAENLIVSIDSVMGIVRHTLTPETQRSMQRSIFAMESLIVGEKQKISQILSNLESISGNLDKNNKSINHIVKNVSNFSDSLASSDLKKAINQANLAMSQANLLLENINNGKGSIGQFVTNQSLYNSLHQSVKDLDSLLVDLNAHPKRYVHFSVFGAKDSKNKK